MTEKARQLIADFKLKGWQTDKPYERLFELAENSDELFAFLEAYLNEFEQRSTLFNDGLSYIDKEQFKKLIKLSIDILQVNKNENAESVIEYASLQFPELLHGHLELIFDLKPNESTYYAEYPWRNLISNSTKYFQDILTNEKASIDDRQKIFSCLLQTRDPETIKYAYEYAKESKLFDGQDAESWLIAQLEIVGYTIQKDTIQSYCPNSLRHFVFTKDYFIKGKPVFINREQHPTWKLGSGDTKYKFGGVLENDDKNPFYHVITFHQIPNGLNITEVEQLTLGVHIRELNEWGALFYQHDPKGIPAKIHVGKENEINIYTDKAIKETFVTFADTPKRWEIQSWGSSNSRENLFRLGGEPAWIQSAEVLTCPVCNGKMDFLMQLDSDLPDNDGGELMFGSGGICYIFWCDRSKVSGYVMQCT